MGAGLEERVESGPAGKGSQVGSGCRQEEESGSLSWVPSEAGQSRGSRCVRADPRKHCCGRRREGSRGEVLEQTITTRRGGRRPPGGFWEPAPLSPRAGREAGTAMPVSEWLVEGCSQEAPLRAGPGSRASSRARLSRTDSGPGAEPARPKAAKTDQGEGRA